VTSNSQDNSVDFPGFGDNSTHLERISLSKFRRRPSDPRCFSDRDIDRATAVVSALPRNAPLPIIVNDQHEILLGGEFVEAARRLKKPWLVAVVTHGLTDVEQIQFSIAVHKVLQGGYFDPLALEAAVRKLEELPDFSHLSLGFDNGELDRALHIPGQLTASEVMPKVRAAAISRIDMLWQLGEHRLINGDAADCATYHWLLGNEMARMMITDPPYGCRIDGFVSKKGLHREFVHGSAGTDETALEALFHGFCQNAYDAIMAGGLAYIFIDWRGLPQLLRVAQNIFGDLFHLCCWAKDRAGMGSFYRSRHELVLIFQVPGASTINNVQLGSNGRNRSNVWDYPSASSSRKGREGDILKHHPTPKPVEMIADAILDCSHVGDIVLDCFGGSGSTLIAAERTRRRARVIELDPLYVDFIIRRWQNWTGLQAIDARTGKSFDEIALESAPSDGEGGNDQ